MKKLFVLITLFPLLGIAYNDFDFQSAGDLAQEGIIIKQSDAKKYRLDDTITRAELVGIALKLKEVTLPDDYYCKNYFTDVKYDKNNNWVCRAMEIAADEGIISRSNTKARPKDTVSFTESMAMISDAQCLVYKRSAILQVLNENNADTENIKEYDKYYAEFKSSLDKSIPSWELEVITGFNQFSGYEVQSKISWLHRKMTRGEVFGLIGESRMTISRFMLGCKKQACEKNTYNSCTSDCLKVCQSSSCVGDDCPATCSDGYCTNKRVCQDLTKLPDFIKWLPGHGQYEPLCKYDCTETNGIKGCNIATD